MPALKNARHEAFAQGLAKGMTAEDAYESAGFKPNRGNAARLKAKDSILRRVAELVGKSAQKAEVSVERVLRGLLKEAEREGEGSSASARVSAWGLLGKHLKMFVEKHELTGADGGPIETEDKTPGGNDLARRIAFALAQGMKKGGDGTA